MCGSLLLEMTNRGVGRQEGGEAGAVWTVYRQQVGAVETHGDVRLISRTTFPLLEIFQTTAYPLHVLVSALGCGKLVAGLESTGTVHCYWTEFEVPAAVKTS